MLLEKKISEKAENLIKKEEKRLGVYVIEARESSNKDVHILSKREYDGEYCVWTAFCTGDSETSYEAFYNGFYTDVLMEAVEEFTKRVYGKENEFPE